MFYDFCECDNVKLFLKGISSRSKLQISALKFCFFNSLINLGIISTPHTSQFLRSLAILIRSPAPHPASKTEEPGGISSNAYSNHLSMVFSLLGILYLSMCFFQQYFCSSVVFQIIYLKSLSYKYKKLVKKGYETLFYI